MSTPAAANSVNLSGSIGMQTGGELALRLLDQARSQHGSLHLDFSAVERADSAALAMLFAVARTVEQHGGTLTFSGMPDKLESLAHLYGVEAILDKHRLTNK